MAVESYDIRSTLHLANSDFRKDRDDFMKLLLRETTAMASETTELALYEYDKRNNEG